MIKKAGIAAAVIIMATLFAMFITFYGCTIPQAQSYYLPAGNSDTSKQINGVFLNGIPENDQLIIAPWLNSKVTRKTYVLLNDTTSQGVELRKAKTIGKVEVNVEYTGKSFPTINQLADYEARLDTFLSHYKPDLLVIENEPLNAAYYDQTTIQDYYNEFGYSVNLAHNKYHLLITDGGTGNFALKKLVYNLKVFPTGLAKYNETKAMLTFLSSSGEDYINLHCYTPAIRDYINYLSKYGKVVSNETGQLDSLASTTDSTLNGGAPLPWLIWYATDGNGIGAVGVLNKNADGTYTLRATGEAYKQYYRPSFAVVTW